MYIFYKKAIHHTIILIGENMKKVKKIRKFRFLSGIPRSGSTLLCNILCQNPEINATHTSGCLDVLFAIRNNWDTLPEHKAHPMPNSKINVLRAALKAYYEDCRKPIILDKSRGWPAHLEMVENILQEKAKIIVSIRSIPDVLASLEKLHRETAKVKQPPGELQNYALFQTVSGRCESWMEPQNVVGISYNRVVDALQRGYGDRMCFVDYDELTSDPQNTLKRIYNFLEEPYFDHNFDNVEQVTVEDDEIHGYVNLHKIQPKVSSKKSQAVEILGEELVKKYKAFNFVIESSNAK